MTPFLHPTVVRPPDAQRPCAEEEASALMVRGRFLVEPIFLPPHKFPLPSVLSSFTHGSRLQGGTVALVGHQERAARARQRTLQAQEALSVPADPAWHRVCSGSAQRGAARGAHDRGGTAGSCCLCPGEWPRSDAARIGRRSAIHGRYDRGADSETRTWCGWHFPRRSKGGNTRAHALRALVPFPPLRVRRRLWSPYGTL
jgi:hypothetical protein